MRRRGLFGALAGLVAAPMVVKAEAIMPVRVWRNLPPRLWGDGLHDDTAALQWLVDNHHHRALRLPAGVFRTSATLHIPERIHFLAGNGAVIRGSGCDGPILHIHAREGVEVFDLSLLGATDYAVRIG